MLCGKERLSMASPCGEEAVAAAGATDPKCSPVWPWCSISGACQSVWPWYSISTSGATFQP